MINLSGASLLSYNHQSNFFGDGIARYSNTKKFSVEGYVTDLTNAFNTVSGIWSGVDALIKSADDWYPIVLNNVVMGTGRILSLSFDQGTWVRSTNYTVEIECYVSGNVAGLDGPYYTDLSGLMIQPAAAPQFIESIDENFSFNQGKNNLIETNHSLNIKFYSGDATNPITRARYWAQQLFGGGSVEFAPSGVLTATGLLYNLYFGSGTLPSGSTLPNKTYYTENYNLITCECSFNERSSYDPANELYFITRSNSVNTDQDGVTNSSESAQIKGLLNPIYSAALSGYYIEQTGVFARCNAAFLNFTDSSFDPLINEAIENGITQNRFEGTIDYNIVFTNNQAMNSGYRWTYTTDIAVDQEIYSVSEQGSILGMGKIGTPQKYNNAVSGYNIVYPGIVTRIGTLYSGTVNPPKTLNEIAASNERSRYKGTIGYNYSWSDDPSLIFDGQINKKTLNVANTIPTYIYGDFVIFGQENTVGREILQDGSNTNLGNDAISITYNYSRVDIPNVQALFARFVSEIQGYASQFSESWVQDCSFSVDEINCTFQGNAGINYTALRSPGDNTLDWT